MNPHSNDPKKAAGDAKTPLHLLPPYALALIAWAHKEGAEKYGAWNWRKTGVCATTYIGAIMRHLAAWQDGEDNDPDSGLSHIAKIGACCNILLDAEHCGKLVDDRSKVGVTQRAEAFKKLMGLISDPPPLESWSTLEDVMTDVRKLVADGKVSVKNVDTPDPIDLSKIHPPPPSMAYLPRGFSNWEYRGHAWTCDDRGGPPWYVNIGCWNLDAVCKEGEKPAWHYERPECKWPFGMGWYYEAVR